MREKKYGEKSNPYSKINAISGGLLLIIIALLCFISLLGGFAGVGKMISSFLLGFFGLASYAYSVCLFIIGVFVMLRKKPKQPTKNIVLSTLIFIFGLMIFQTTTSSNLINLSYGDYLAKCYEVNFTAGGLLYGLFTYPIMKLIKPTATIVVLSLLMVALAIVLAMPLVNKEFTFSFSRKDRPSSFNGLISTKNRDKNRDANVNNPKEPSLTLFDDESEEVIGEANDSGIAYRRIDNNQMADFDGGKRSRFRVSKPNQDNEDNEFDENIDVDSIGATEDKDLRRKEALKKLYPEKSDKLLGYEGGILDDIRKVNKETETEEDNKYKNLNLADIIRQSNTEEGQRRLLDEKLASIKAMEKNYEPRIEEVADKPTEDNENNSAEDIDDKCYYIDQFGVKRRYYGLDLQKTIEENEKKMRAKVEADNSQPNYEDKEEENRLEEEKRLEEERKQQRLEEERLEQKRIEARRLEEERIREEKRLEEERIAQEKRLAEEKRLIEERKEEEARLEQKRKELEEQQKELERLKQEQENSNINENVEEEISNKQTADDFNKINFKLGFNPDEKAVDIDELDEQETPKKKVVKTDFSYNKVMEEEKQKTYEQYDVEAPTGELLEQFVKDDEDNCSATVDVNRRSDFGGTHKKKFMNEENIEFIKKALGKAEDEPAHIEEKKEEDEKYPYIPKYITGGEYSYMPPKIDLLKEYDTVYRNADDYEEKGLKIEETLRGLGIETKVVAYTQGPAFSRYELDVDPTVNLARLVNARDNLSLALATKGSVRIEAPISGKSRVGVEVPNAKRVTVGLREVISSKEFYNPDSELSIALGKDIAGQIHIGDINKLTHILIAGSTGSGKSVCLNSLLTSILYKYSPEDVRLILVDPKRVELSVYNGIPHMLVPNAIKEPEQAISALKWLDREMVRRLELFEEVGSRNILGYNSKVKPEEKLPRIILVIDEFADIMVQSQKIGTEMEDLISRIARMARAVGIHLILATQRPSAEYITGSIKVNIPCKIAFATANGTNSRIIIDSLGAEKLLGNGDMLFVHREPQPIRMQCPFLSDDEVGKIVDYVKDNNKCEFDERIEDDIMNCAIDKPAQQEPVTPVKIDNKAKLDEMFLKVLKFLIEDNYNSPPSITKVQREFEMGFPRSAGLLDKMTKMGFLTKDSRKYNLNITMDEFNKLFGDEVDE